MWKIELSAIEYAKKILSNEPGYTLDKAKKIYGKYYYLVERYYSSDYVINAARQRLNRNQILSPAELATLVKSIDKVTESYKQIADDYNKWYASLPDSWKAITAKTGFRIQPFTLVQRSMDFINDRCIAIDEIKVTYFTPSQYMKYVDQYKHQANLISQSGILGGIRKANVSLNQIDNQLIELFKDSGYLIEKI